VETHGVVEHGVVSWMLSLMDSIKCKFLVSRNFCGKVQNAFQGEDRETTEKKISPEIGDMGRADGIEVAAQAAEVSLRGIPLRRLLGELGECFYLPSSATRNAAPVYFSNSIF
jgi:hypothetical protein